MRKLVVALSCAFVLTMAACSCTLEKQSIDQIETMVKTQQSDHKALMTKTSRPDAEVKDWDAHYLKLSELIGRLRKSAK